ncbi:response regulator [Mucilaginibacter hurinus]|uniref:Response regulator n=1 Tax=Mucilaginibacter hurinus TaxID=2201324 RepID=A0A367GKY6_9SPHI|nr:response regulator [Mucilaginibacter hurinus]RCH53618.1 response regulator [Mucilaginibacter hurinus]
MSAPFKYCLLIDDNYIDNFVTSRILETASFAEKIEIFQSASLAIEALRTGASKPDVIFLDIRMPLMTGFEFLQEFETLTIDKSGIKIFMLSSSLDPTDLRKSSDNKYVTQFIHKPLTFEVLEEICT